MELIKTWVMGITAAALISAIATALTPQGKLRKTVALVCGFLTIAMMAGPLKDFNFESYSSYMVEFKNQTGMYGASLENENERLVRAIIEERSAAYILDKAESLGINNLEVKIITRAGEGDYPYPYSVTIRGEAAKEQKAQLCGCIESELGIPVSRQYWNDG